jgi:hypothetical protein
MESKFEELQPYKSLLIIEFRVSPAKMALKEVFDDTIYVLGLDGKDQGVKLISRNGPTVIGKLEMAFAHFTRQQRASWTRNSEIVDTLNHLVLLCRYETFVGIFLSDPSLRNRLASRLDDSDGKGLAMMKRVPQARLNAAFVQGQTRTLWLSGIHRRTAVKADSKILSGVDLRDALNPLDDQTYNFTAARCMAEIAKSTIAVGVAPRKSRVWLGLSRSWSDFCEATTQLLSHLDTNTKYEPAPLPVLVRPVFEVKNVRDAFDVSIQPPELVSDDPSTQLINLAELEKWCYESNFDVTKTQGADFSARLVLERQLLGDISFSVNLSDVENVRIAASGQPISPSMKEKFEEALRLCNRSDWLNVRYDSGHTISNGSIHEVRYRDVAFNNFVWVDFNDFAVDIEKPTPLTAVGTKKSLFCWVQKHWPLRSKAKATGGWLVCDDGSMEIADFIHLDLIEGVPLLSLIHVKGAGSDKSGRSISVSNYEVVTGQAIKNLRYFDRLLLEEGLASGLKKKIGKLVWFNHVKKKREEFLDVLKIIGTNFRRQVVVLQPHVTKVCHDLARQHPKSPDAARLRQLDTLLFGAEMSCRGLQAELRVIAASK